MAEGLKRHDLFELKPVGVHFLRKAGETAVQPQTNPTHEASLLDFLSNPNDLTQGGDK